MSGRGDNAMGINALDVAAIAEAKMQQEGEIARFKGCSQQREVELDELLRSRERTVKELEEHLRAALSMLTKRDVTIATLESRLAAAQQETEEYRARLAKVVQRAATRHQRTATEPVSKPRRPARAARRSARKKPKRKGAGKRR
jgi:septal ring factor EnvC (AmiA/AmiB activator)